MIICQICCKELKSEKALRAHNWRAHTEEGKVHKVPSPKGRSSTRKGLTKETSEAIKRISEKVKATVNQQIINGTFIPRRMGIEARQKLSIEQSLHNRGGKCKWFDYNGQKLQGTWEYNVAIKLDELGIKWYKPIVNRDVWKYTINSKMRSYTPDLYLPELNLYLEIKGYWWGNDKEKMKAVLEQHSDKTVVILEKEEYNKLMCGELVW